MSCRPAILTAKRQFLHSNNLLFLMLRKLRLDANYYIVNGIIPPLKRIFNLVGCDVDSWFNEMSRISLLSAPASEDIEDIKVKLTDHYRSNHCLICGQKCGVCEFSRKKRTLIGFSTDTFLLCLPPFFQRSAWIVETRPPNRRMQSNQIFIWQRTATLPSRRSALLARSSNLMNPLLASL